MRRPALFGLLLVVVLTACGSSKPAHGLELVSTAALPGNQMLSQTAEKIVTVTTDLGLAVTLRDSGRSKEVQVEVTLTIEQAPTPIIQVRTIRLIDPGEEKTVIFRGLGQVQFATRTRVKVDVQPVPQEEKVTDNSAVYPVVFSLG